MASLNNLLNRASDYQMELDLIAQRIELLAGMANAILEKGTNSIELILETHPRNGAMPVIVPIFAPPEISLEGPSEPLQIGFQRFYQLRDLGDERLLTVAVPLETPLAMAVIDRCINRLKHRRDVVIKRSKSILRSE